MCEPSPWILNLTTQSVMPAVYVKGFTIDYTKVHDTFAPLLKDRSVKEAHLALIAEAVDQRFDIAMTRSDDKTKPAPCVLVLARDHDKDNLEGTAVEKSRVGWLEQFLEKEMRVFEEYQ